jgi:hypothetical protein
LALVAPRSAHNFEFTGFDSPLVGDVNSLVGLVGADGDAGTVGDSLTVRGPTITTLTFGNVNISNFTNITNDTNGYALYISINTSN